MDICHIFLTVRGDKRQQELSLNEVATRSSPSHTDGHTGGETRAASHHRYLPRITEAREIDLSVVLRKAMRMAKRRRQPLNSSWST